MSEQQFVALCLILLFIKPICRALGRLLLRSAKRSSRRLPGQFRTRIRVIDGDTVYAIANNTKIRLHGIDAPESGQAQGRHSTNFLRDLTADSDVIVKPIEFDRYGRIVATLLRCQDSLNLNAAMVANGYALAERRYSKEYLGLQRSAKRGNAGLWAMGKIQDPRAWRQAHR